MKDQLKKMANMVMDIDHMGVQCDNIHKCEEKHQAILQLDKLDRYDAVRLLMHIIEVQNLQLVGAKIDYDYLNPFQDMVYFEGVETYVNSNSPNMETLY